MTEFKDIILGLRLEKGFNQEEVAKILNVSKSTVGMWEIGKRLPGPDKYREIADYFNVDMDYLYGRTNMRKNIHYNKNSNKHILSEFKSQKLDNMGNKFKDRLKYFRKREHLSQSELAAKLGISASTISMYEVGKREPDFETEEKIADFFNTDLNTLRGRDIEAPPSHYYLNDETAETAQEIFEKDRVLFDVYRSTDKDRLIAYAKKLKALQDQEKGEE